VSESLQGSILTREQCVCMYVCASNIVCIIEYMVPLTSTQMRPFIYKCIYIYAFVCHVHLVWLNIPIMRSAKGNALLCTIK
jgi:hypothetical protein